MSDFNAKPTAIEEVEGMDLVQHLDTIEEAVKLAREAIEDEHEFNLNRAIGFLHMSANEAYRIVHNW